MDSAIYFNIRASDFCAHCLNSYKQVIHLHLLLLYFQSPTEDPHPVHSLSCVFQPVEWVCVYNKNPCISLIKWQPSSLSFKCLMQASAEVKQLKAIVPLKRQSGEQALQTREGDIDRLSAPSH